MDKEAQNPNDVKIPVISDNDETVWMTPPEYYCWLGRQLIQKQEPDDELPLDVAS